VAVVLEETKVVWLVLKGAPDLPNSSV